MALLLSGRIALWHECCLDSRDGLSLCPLVPLSPSNAGGIGTMAVLEDGGLVRCSVRGCEQVLSIVVERCTTGDGELMPKKRGK